MKFSEESIEKNSMEFRKIFIEIRKIQTFIIPNRIIFYTTYTVVLFYY